MFLKNLNLKDFRSYGKARFDFEKNTIVIVGPNTAGKTNFTEAISLLSTGKSVRAEKYDDLIGFGETSAKISGDVLENNDDVSSTELAIIVALHPSTSSGQGSERLSKKFLINKVAKRRIDFAGNLLSILFSPEDLDIIIGGPSLRRRLLNEILEQADRDYRNAFSIYEKALRQRNALLYNARETGRRNEKQFEYWDKLIIENGNIVTAKREELIVNINDSPKDIFDFIAFYDKSTISEERLAKYRDAELSSGVTLVGPHRDDIGFSMLDNTTNSTHDIKSFGSRGQQRLTILQIKIIELSLIERKTGTRPVLVMDDIFSELDSRHIKLIFDILGKQQTFITTTHKEFINEKKLGDMQIIDVQSKSS